MSVFGTGRYAAGVVRLSWPRAVVRELVPGWLSLPEGERADVLLLFGEHSEVRPRTRRADLLAGLGISYRETLVAVPDVETQGVRMAWICKMYLSKRLPVLLGMPYAYPKRFARLTALPSVDVADRAGRPLLAGHFSEGAHGLGFPAGAFDQPFVGQLGGVRVYSRMRFEVGPDDVQPASARVWLHDKLGEGHATGELVHQGAWRVRSRWTLDLPQLRVRGVR